MPRETSTDSPDAESQADVKGEPGQDRGISSVRNEQLDAQADPGAPKDVLDGNGDLGAGYGTRSRNRSGQSRPNYAEDKDIENDVYDFYNESKDGDVKRASRHAAAAAAAANGEVTTANTTTSRKATTIATDDSKASATLNGVKETNAIPASSNSNSTTTQPSRKRKATAATGASQANGGSTTVATRRGAQATQSTGTAWPETNLLTFENCKARPQNGRMVADDGTVLEANDHVYLVCEPPGEPYYLGRIMEFLHAKNDSTRPVDALRINWYYRPKDIGRKVQDTRLVFATMHSDISPLTALRGKCQIQHRAEIDSMDEYRKRPDSFWFEKLYDRYIQKNYDLIPTPKIVNVPDKVKKVLDERWKYVLVEQGRGKELTSAVKLCKRCSSYCASNDSVDCAVCHKTYHMNCVKPPLLKKPSRGFAWSCAACSRAQEKKLEARHTPNVNDPNADLEDEEMLDEEDDDMHAIETERNSPVDGDDHHQGTAEQIYQASLWPYRYLGMHCKPEDALDYDDRIYPRASTRIGPRHQAIVGPWTGQPVPFAQPDGKRSGKKDTKANRDPQSGQDSDKNRKGKKGRGQQDQSLIYYERGGDPNDLDPTSTLTLAWKPPPSGSPTPEEVEEYMDKARQLSDKLKLPKHSTNLQDVALQSYCRNDYNPDKALKTIQKLDREEFKEPTLTPTELKKFEEGIEKHGSELQAVRRLVKTLKPGTIVRFYYTWKKTPRGRQIWDNHGTRKSKKEVKKAEAEANKLADDVADPDDDSAFDSSKAAERKRAFLCQFCSTTNSRQWRRAPSAIPGLVTETGAKATSKDKGPQYVMALCRRCAELWRRYAIRWEDMDEVAKKVAQSGGKAWKRKQDEELLKELQAARELGMATPDERPSTPQAVASTAAQEPPRKKLKGLSDKDGDLVASDGANTAGAAPSKKKEKATEAVVAPEMPKPRVLPCAVCNEKDPPDTEPGNQHVTCRECRLTVHRHCYGIMEQRGPGKWLCDMCTNDKNPQVSIRYKCVLCPIEHTEHEFVEQPKLTHHKKKMSDKDREREKLEVQQARKAVEQYRKRQEELNRPVNPREPLKRTADNNWVHVTCAVWTPEVKFGNARAIEPSEGIPSIPRARYEETCQACHATNGATISCHHCRLNFHVECARQHGHVLGFDITPVKSSRRDQLETVNINGTDGVLSARLWCKNHLPTKTTVVQMNERVQGADLNVLQVYVQTYKQADLTLTGTVRKANLMAAAAKLSGVPAQTVARRQSTITGANGAVKTEVVPDPQTAVSQSGQWVCISCGIDVSPKWWPIDQAQERELTNGHYGAIGTEARKFVEQRRFQCHRCKKTNRTPKPHAAAGLASVAAMQVSQMTHPDQVDTPMASSSPHHGHRSMYTDPRDPRPVSRGWGPHSHPPATGAPIPPAQHSGHQGPEYPSPHAAPPRPAFASGPYQPGPVGPVHSVHSDWPPRPSSQHGSPPQHMNGGPPSLQSGPPPLSGLGSLRPPPISGLLPPGPITGSPHHGMAPQPYMNGMPPSPRRHSSGPAPPSPYIGPYATGSSHLPPPPRNGPHVLSNGGPPPPPPMRNDGYPSGMPPQRDPRGMPLPRAAYPAPHASPPGSRSGLPLAHDGSSRSGSIPPRNPEPRPASGASASPSLRNLLS